MLLGWIPREGTEGKQYWAVGQVELWCCLSGKHRWDNSSEPSWVGEESWAFDTLCWGVVGAACGKATLLSLNNIPKQAIIEHFLPAALLVARRVSPSLLLKGMVHHSIHPGYLCVSTLVSICGIYAKTPNTVTRLNRCSFIHSSIHSFILFFPEVTGENQLVISPFTSKKGFLFKEEDWIY